MRKAWWKIICVILLTITIIAGFLGKVPAQTIVHESIRNLYFHVPMWFVMMVLFTVSAVYAVRYLRSNNLKDDLYSLQFTNIGLLFGVLGLITGMEWANFTWGAAWSNDPKQLGSALCLLSYFAYIALRGSISDYDKKAKISAVYNIFAFALMFPFIWIIPKLTDSLHPGSGGNTGFKSYDTNHDMMVIFYPAIIGWILLAVWITSLAIRINLIEKKDLISDEQHH
jgi:heme exporter protein C